MDPNGSVISSANRRIQVNASAASEGAGDNDDNEVALPSIDMITSHSNTSSRLKKKESNMFDASEIDELNLGIDPNKREVLQSIMDVDEVPDLIRVP